MIGVLTRPDEKVFAEEFFELFKTPWEFFVPGRRYDVVLSTAGLPDGTEASLCLVYGSDVCALDEESGVVSTWVDGPQGVEAPSGPLPVYGRIRRFKGPTEPGLLTLEGTRVDYRRRSPGCTTWRVGYDLFGETRYLLTQGQPACWAMTPTLELHIDLIRSAILDAGLAIVEVPPKPYGSEFVCCLTHDLDFFGITRHWFDRTLAGFVVRASVGSLIDFVRGRRPAADVARNLAAVCSLPLVFLGVKPDFWQPVSDYLAADRGIRSTFFVVPFRERPGVSPGGAVEAARAVKYQASDVAPDLDRAVAVGSEVAIHGIDAWRDVEAGRAELGELRPWTRASAAGVRMHWLYFDDGAPRRLEEAGFDYDSTCGYNDAVGYRAGTSQVFRLPATADLMELPLSLMDSALFFPDRMGLDSDAASGLCRTIVENAKRLGGTLVINWHDRSLAPERLWERPYSQLIEHARSSGAWFATASEAVQWFRWRRGIRLVVDSADAVVTVQPPSGRAARLPPAVVRVKRSGQPVEERPIDGECSLKVRA